MKVVLQRVLQCSVKVNNEVLSSIGNGLLVLIGISRGDTKDDIEYMVRKILNLRIFDFEGTRWSKSVMDMQFEVLCVSQFTLCHKLKGNKLDFHNAMEPNESNKLYETFLNELRIMYEPDKVKEGKFGAHMRVDLCNDGPVTIELESNLAQTKH